MEEEVKEEAASTAHLLEQENHDGHYKLIMLFV
jgi:hypothetical protein